MKNKNLVYAVIVVHGIFIFLHVYKHTHITAAKYTLEQLKNERLVLLEEKQELLQEWYGVQDPEYIRYYAQQKLNMRPANLTQVHALNDNNKK